MSWLVTIERRKTKHKNKICIDFETVKVIPEQVLFNDHHGHSRQVRSLCQLHAFHVDRDF